jgi:sec-independent protein translocase protein TatA
VKDDPDALLFHEADPSSPGPLLYDQPVASLAFLGSNELLIVAIVAIVLFGGSQLPKLARNLGRAQRELKQGIAEGSAEANAATKRSGSDDDAAKSTSKSDDGSEGEDEEGSGSTS